MPQNYHREDQNQDQHRRRPARHPRWRREVLNSDDTSEDDASPPRRNPLILVIVLWAIAVVTWLALSSNRQKVDPVFENSVGLLSSPESKTKANATPTSSPSYTPAYKATPAPALHRMTEEEIARYTAKHPEYALAAIDTGEQLSIDDPRIKLYGDYLDFLVSKTVEGRNSLATTTMNSVQLAKKDNWVRQSLKTNLGFLGAMRGLYSEGKNVKQFGSYSDACVFLLMLNGKQAS